MKEKTIKKDSNSTPYFEIRLRIKIEHYMKNHPKDGCMDTFMKTFPTVNVNDVKNIFDKLKYKNEINGLSSKLSPELSPKEVQPDVEENKSLHLQELELELALNSDVKRNAVKAVLSLLALGTPEREIEKMSLLNLKEIQEIKKIHEINVK